MASLFPDWLKANAEMDVLNDVLNIRFFDVVSHMQIFPSLPPVATVLYLCNISFLCVFMDVGMCGLV